MKGRGLAAAAIVLAVIGTTPASGLVIGPEQQPAVSTRAGTPRPGAPGVGDPYYPRDGNGGYVVRHYGLDLRYHPHTGWLAGVTTVNARSRQALSSFHLDFMLRTRSVSVNGVAASFHRCGSHELVVRPADPIRTGERMRIAVSYRDRPERITSRAGFAWWHRSNGQSFINGEPEE